MGPSVSAGGQFKDMILALDLCAICYILKLSGAPQFMFIS